MLRVGDTLDGQNILILLPDNFDPGVEHNLIIYHHGLGETATSLVTDLVRAPMIDDLLADGYIIAASLAQGNRWGNDATLVDYLTLYAYITARYSIGSVLALSQSMGGIPGLLLVADGTIPYVGWAGIYPVCNLANMYAYGGDVTTGINTSYEINGASYEVQTAGHDPVLLDGSIFTLPMRFYASPDDTTVNKAANSDAMATLVTGYATEHEVVACTGNHGDPSHFQSADLQAFFTRCLA